MTQVQGNNDPKFEKVRALLQGFVESGDECGASIAVNLNGQTVIDIWGGYKDEARTQPWEQDTIVNVWSSTKTVLNLASLIAIDRGLLDTTTKVAKVWPEFNNNGKENIEFRMLMSHTAGLSAWEAPVTVPELYDTEKMTRLLAEQAPLWEPGSASGYHATNQGHLVGEVIKRVTGRSLTQFVAEDIAGPLQADFQIGCAEKDWPRAAEMIAPPPFDLSFLDSDSITAKTLLNGVAPATAANTPEFRRAEMGAINGHSNARALAKILSTITLGGEVDGVRLLKPETIELIFQEQAFGTDLVLGLPIRFGTGYGLGGKDTDVHWLPDEKMCFWSGWGGSMVVMDLKNGLTFAYTMNKMGPGTLGNDRTKEYVKAVYQALGITL